jgi:hypothetical protein
MAMSDIKWGQFSLSDDRFFTLESSKCSIDKIKLNLKGTKQYPYVNRSEKFNGIGMLIPKQEMEANKANVITIGLDTQTVFYQEQPFYTGQNIQILSSPYMTKNIALFLIPVIKKQLKYLSWGGTGATLTRLRKKNILLPVNKHGFPDWSFMENFMNKKYESLLIRKPVYELVQLQGLEKYDNIKWAEFRMRDVFYITTGNYVPAKDIPIGNIPRISAKSVNNGISSYTNEIKGSKVYSNAITASFLGNYFYHPYKFTADLKIHVLEPKHIELNKYIGLFLITILRKYIGIYNYGNQLSSSDLKTKIIKLPITNQSKPNWDFMQSYMIDIYNKKIQRINKI